MTWRRMKRGLGKNPSEWELGEKLPEIEKLKELYKKGEIDLGCLDQASIHASNKIMERLEHWKEKNLELFWLLAYSLELNLIGILWRFMKYEWLTVSAYYSYKTLKDYIDKTLQIFGYRCVINFA